LPQLAYSKEDDENRLVEDFFTSWLIEEYCCRLGSSDLRAEQVPDPQVGAERGGSVVQHRLTKFGPSSPISWQ